MTTEDLRDKFAAAALQGMLAGNPGAHLMDTATERAYDYADSMLSERAKREPVSHSIVTAGTGGSAWTATPAPVLTATDEMVRRTDEFRKAMPVAPIPASVVKALEMARDRFEGMGSAEQLPGHANYMSKAAMAASARDGALECAAALDDPASVPVTLDAQTLAKIAELHKAANHALYWVDGLDGTKEGKALRAAVSALDTVRLKP